MILWTYDLQVPRVSIETSCSAQLTKGQLISKCLFGVFDSPKIRTKTIWLEVPQYSKVDFLKLLFGRLKIPERHFEINWPHMIPLMFFFIKKSKFFGFCTIKPNIYITVNLGNKKRFDKKQISIKEPFSETNLPFTS